MQAAAEDIVRLWEKGQRLGSLGRTMLLLRAARPELDAASAAALSLGTRDAAILTLREQLFGSGLTMFSPCPRCRTELEVSCTTTGVRAATSPSDAIYLDTFDGIAVSFRVPNSGDLRAIGAEESTKTAYLALLARCIVALEREGAALTVESLAATTIDAIAERMLEHDAQAEILFHVTCPNCSHVWPTVLDIGSYLWAEITTEARRLLLEVHALAAAYGWHERDVLCLSAERRKFYLDLVGVTP